MSNQASPVEQRREERLEVCSIVLPFLGSREHDHTPFQYLLEDLSLHGAKIAIPRWLAKREQLHKGDEVDFHVPFLFEGELFSVGAIAWARWEEERESQVCGARFERAGPPAYPVVISFDTQKLSVDLTKFSAREDLMLRVLKDAVLLKRGIRIYLKHLAPYLSRIVDVGRQDYAFLREFLLEDAAAHVERNRERLQAAWDELSEGVCSQRELASCLNVEDLLDAFEPEIPADVFSSSFLGDAVIPYINSIKILEKKLYTNYNTLMLLYISSI